MLALRSMRRARNSRLNRDIGEPSLGNNMSDRGNDGVGRRKFAYAAEPLHKSAATFNHNIPGTKVESVREHIRLAAYAYKIGSPLVLGCMGPAKVLHAKHVSCYACAP